jgi:hypothetical protein
MATHVKSAYEVNRLDNNSVILKMLVVITGEAVHYHVVACCMTFYEALIEKMRWMMMHKKHQHDLQLQDSMTQELQVCQHQRWSEGCVKQ